MLLCMLAALFYLNFLARIIISPLLPTLEKNMGISHGQAGSLFLFLSSGYFIAVLASGFVSARIGHQRTITLSSLAIGIFLLFLSWTQSLWHLRLGQLLLGLTAGLYLPSAIATITGCFSRKHWGKALAVHELAPNLAFLSAPFLVTFFLQLTSWNSIFAGLGVIALVSALLFGLISRKQQTYGVEPSFAQCQPLFALPSFWKMILLFSLGIMSTLGIYNLLPLFLVSEHGMSEQAANSLVGLSRIPTLLTALIGGWLADRFGARATMGGVLFVTGLMTIMLGFSDEHISLFVFLQPLLAVCFFPAGFAALSALGPPEARNVVISLTVPMAFLAGNGILPAAIGRAADFGWFGEGMAMAGLLMICGAMLVRNWELRITN